MGERGKKEGWNKLNKKYGMLEKKEVVVEERIHWVLL